MADNNQLTPKEISFLVEDTHDTYWDVSDFCGPRPIAKALYGKLEVYVTFCSREDSADEFGEIPGFMGVRYHNKNQTIELGQTKLEDSNIKYDLFAKLFKEYESDNISEALQYAKEVLHESSYTE